MRVATARERLPNDYGDLVARLLPEVPGHAELRRERVYRRRMPDFDKYHTLVGRVDNREVSTGQGGLWFWAICRWRGGVSGSVWILDSCFVS